MRIPKPIARRVIYPLKEAPLRRSTLSVLAALQASERWPKEQLDRLRAMRLTALIRHAYDHVPYYRALFDEHRLRPDDVTQPSHLDRLPILTKDIARVRWADLRARTSPKGFTQTLFTSGSTGEPFAVLVDPLEMSSRLANQLRGRSWHRVEIGDPEVRVMLGARAFSSVPLRWRTFWRASAFKDRLLNVTPLVPIDFSEARMAEWERVIAATRPAIIYGFAVCILFLAQFLHARGRRAPVGVRAVALTGEKIQPSQKHTIREAFGAPVVDEYGSIDCGVIAFECERGRLHTSDESALLEVEHPTADGTGELVVTSLTNYSMPLIRYRPGDVVALSSDVCSCGRTLGVMREVVGRTSDYLTDARGIAVNPTPLIHSVQQHRAVTRFRIVQSAVGQVELTLQLSRSLEPAERAAILREFHRVLGSETAAAIRVVDVLPLGASGKYRFVSNLASDRRHQDVSS